MATTLDWETLQRNYVRSSTRGDRTDQPHARTNSGDAYINGFDTQGLNYKGSLNSQRVTVKSHAPELVKTKISRAAEGNFYAVFKDQSRSEASMSQNRSISPRNLPLKGAQGLNLDYNDGDVERFTNMKQSRIDGDQINKMDNGICTLEESTMSIMEKKKDFKDNHSGNHSNNTKLRAEPRKRYVQSKNSLNANSICVRTRRYQVKSEGNLEEKVKNSRSLLSKMDAVGSETKQGSDQVEIRRINGGESGIYISDACEVTDMVTSEEKNRGLKCKQELVDQSNYFGKMLKQFKEKEIKREELIAKRKQGIIEKSQPELTQGSMEFEMRRESSDFSLHRLASDQSENSVKFDENEAKPRFPRRKISYMDSWLQSQQSRITNLVEAVRGESFESENECQSRKSSIGFIEEGFHPHADRNTISTAAGDKRKKFSHTKTASFDAWYSRDSDTESEVLAASEVSDSNSYRSITSDADAKWHPRGVEMPPSAPQVKVDVGIVRSEHVNETRPMGGAHEQESVNFSSCNKPLGQKLVKRDHPLAVVKPFHVDQKDEIKIGEQIVKTRGESLILTTKPPLETDLDTVLSLSTVTESYGERKVPVNAGKSVMETKSNQESSTRVAIVTIQKKQVGGIVEKRTVKHGMLSTDAHPMSENQGEIVAEIGEKSAIMENIGGNRENSCQNEVISSEKGPLHDERDDYEYLQDVEGRRERFLDLRAQFDQPRSPEKEKLPKNIRSSKVHIEPVQQTQRGSIIFNFDSKNATCTAKVDLRGSEATITSESDDQITVGLKTCEKISTNELADLNCQRLEFLTEAFQQDENEENEGAEKSLCHGVTDIASTGYPIELLYRDNINVASSEDRNSTDDRNIPYYIDGNLYFMSEDGLRPDFDRASVISSDSRLTGLTDRTVTDIQSLRHPFGSPQSRSAEITSSEEEDSTSDEEELKTLSERIRPWNPMESEALGKTNDMQGRESGNTNVPVVMRKRQGKGAVDRINKSLSVVMGELKELRKQDIDLAKQLLTLGKSIKEFKKQKQEMEEEMLADYFMDMESDQLSLDDNLSLASYDSHV